MVAGSCLGQTDQETVEFSILGEVRRAVSKTATLDFWMGDFEHFRTLVGRVPWEPVLKGREVQEGSTLLKKEALKVQGQAVPMCQKMSQQGRRPTWLNRELLLSVQKKKGVYVQWKKGQITRGEYNEAASIYRGKITKAKAQYELNLATMVKDNQNVFKNILIARGGPRTISILYWMQSGKMTTENKEKG